MKVKSTKDKSCCILCLMTQLNGYSHLTFSLASLSLAAHLYGSSEHSQAALWPANEDARWEYPYKYPFTTANNVQMLGRTSGCGMRYPGVKRTAGTGRSEVLHFWSGVCIYLGGLFWCLYLFWGLVQGLYWFRGSGLGFILFKEVKSGVFIQFGVIQMP